MVYFGYLTVNTFPTNGPTMRFLPLLLIAGLLSCQDAKDTVPPPPNVLFVIGDDISWPHLSAYGTSWVRTPNCDRIAAEGLMFSNAYTPNAKCGPSRSILLTGRNGWQLGPAINHLAFWPDTLGSIWEALNYAGYHTGFTGKGWAPGNPGERNGAPRQLTGRRYSALRSPPPTSAIADIDYAANFGAFLQDRSGEQPFAFWYGSLEPHRAYEFGSGARVGGKTVAMIDSVPAYWPDVDSVRQDMLDYALEIEHFDQHLGLMLDTLEAMGELDNTLIIVTADNGMPFPRVKGQAYHDANHLPFLIRFPPGIKQPGRIVKEFVNFIDVAPTLADYCGLNAADLADMKTFQGRSLRPLLEANVPENWQDFVLLNKERHDVGRPQDWGYPIRGIREGNFLLLVNYAPERWPAGDPVTGYLNSDGSATKSVMLNQRRRAETTAFWEMNFGKRPALEFYDVVNDRHCLHNLAEEERFAAEIERMRAKMENELAAQGDLRMIGQGGVYEAFPVAPENQRGYYEKFMAGDTVRAGWIFPSDYETLLPE
jgi:N-sulfoglucosamine sulfohydrolase